jgi:hypothetical protein
MIKTCNDNSNYIKQLYRDFQIQIIQGRKFQINEKNYQEFIKGQQFKLYQKFTPGEIITGSTALKLFGLINRDTSDIDIVLEDINKFGPLQKIMYTVGELDNYLGTKYFQEKKFFFKTIKHQFDFFECVNTEYVVHGQYVGTIKIELPMNIINKKIQISDYNHFNDKHMSDLVEILS